MSDLQGNTGVLVLTPQVCGAGLLLTRRVEAKREPHRNGTPCISVRLPETENVLALRVGNPARNIIDSKGDAEAST